MRFWKLASVATALVLSSSVNAANLPVGSVYDQGYNYQANALHEDSGLSNVIGAGSSEVGVVFSPGTSGELTSFSIALSMGYAPTNGSAFTVSLYEYDDMGQATIYSNGWTAGLFNNSPFGSALTTESFTAPNYDAGYSQYSTNLSDIFNFENAIHIDAEKRYALMVHELSANMSWEGGHLSTNLGWDDLPPPGTGSLNHVKGGWPANWNYSETNQLNFSTYIIPDPVSTVPVPAAVWLFGSGLIGLVGLARRKKA